MEELENQLKLLIRGLAIRYFHTFSLSNNEEFLRLLSYIREFEEESADRY